MEAVSQVEHKLFLAGLFLMMQFRRSIRGFGTASVALKASLDVEVLGTIL